MSVYVDALVKNGWILNGARIPNCHLFTDGPEEELHAFAKKLGMKRRWVQRGGMHKTLHYDLSPSRRISAIEAGAIELSQEEAVAIWRGGSRKDAAPPFPEPTEDLFGKLASVCRRPLLRYHGSKWRLAPWIISQFPEHRAYVEIFGGGAGVLLRKQRSKIEVYNDLDSQVFNLFRVLRDRDSMQALVRLVDLTPFSREEFELSYEAAVDPVEAARRFVVRCYLGHGTCSVDPNDSNGFRSCDIRAGKSYAREWAGVPDAVAFAADRFQGVTIENLDFRKLIPKFDDPDTLLYVDPPYPMETRDAGGKGFVHEMGKHEHEQLAWLLKNAKSKVMISGYPCSLYDGLYDGWRRNEKATTANGQRGAVPRTEVVWTNFEPTAEAVA